MLTIKLTLFLIFTFSLAFVYLPILIMLYPWRRGIGPWMMQIYCMVCLSIFRVTVEHADKINVSEAKNKGIILISNHVSFLDIFFLSALYRTVYVSKIGVKYYPLIGQIAWLCGIIFLRRTSAEDRHNVIRTLAYKSRGRVITVFPQGTTSSIADPLPFKCGIFKTVEINHEIILLPVTIQYKEDKEIAWTREQVLIGNIRKVCLQNRIHVKSTVHERISIDDYRDKTISEVCAMAQEKVLNIPFS